MHARSIWKNDFVLAGLKALSDFTYKITMPFLNCIEKADQETLCKVLPKLHQDLSNIRMDTFEKYHVEWKHVNTKANAPSSELCIVKFLISSHKLVISPI